MKKFEYSILRIRDIFDREAEANLNDYGKRGWELVSSYQEVATDSLCHWHIFVFKREVQ